ncbi:MAG: DnaJ domain-containing protein [Alphaproteobacteria bacterium]|nr:DnaJ domain-containing protein [Alphaproteobacteria bacterium]MDX5369325.1 DnaJ domain-containing protein [Alphaproteobacteria bacterium]MDX5464010.1 DnaJ domain-containing protein [Alphaproteobacteria bacterium]
MRSDPASPQLRLRTRVRVTAALTEGHMLDGFLFLGERERLVDLMNDARRFLPFETITGEFVLIAKDEIRAVRPAEGGGAAHAIYVGDPYTVLGVHRGDSDEAIKQAYYALLRQLHPQQAEASGLHPALVDCAGALTRRVIEAYDYILRSRKRGR